MCCYVDDRSQYISKYRDRDCCEILYRFSINKDLLLTKTDLLRITI